MPEHDILSKNLRYFREIMRQSQEEFADGCGISVETLSLLERKKGDPRLSTIQKIAAYVDCTPAELIRERGDEDGM